MPGVPGQRAAQHPMRAAAASQRVLGRAASQQTGGPPIGPVGVAILGGVYYTVDLSGGVPRLVPRPPPSAVPKPAVPKPGPLVADPVAVVDAPPKPRKRTPRAKRKPPADDD